MKVTESTDNLLKFDNGLSIIGEGEQDCCEYNYIDFDQFEVGMEFPTMTAQDFLNQVNVKEDGFALTDINGIPKWAQARSEQNGYYSDITTLLVSQWGLTVEVTRLTGLESE